MKELSFRCTETVVLIESLAVETYVGQYAKERNRSQAIIVDLRCTLRSPEVPNDLLKNSVDYVPIVERIRELAVSRKRSLIETFAEEIAILCFESRQVENVVVSVRKPNKLPDVESVGITRTFRREEE